MLQYNSIVTIIYFDYFFIFSNILQCNSIIITLVIYFFIGLSFAI